ncbi:hypothetical protein [Desulfosporosinus lacus]|uniref:hypothetical protein n=1 Tax=Desulfosporosinus lacus TaxID=329936 RepID=UPI0013566A86|nr:hypothetical protein [Desulfosporosinus lacus]
MLIALYTSVRCGGSVYSKVLLTWDEAVQSGVQVARGKGWNLGRLAQYVLKFLA